MNEWVRYAFEKDKTAQFIFQNMELRLHLEMWKLKKKWKLYSTEVENQMYYITFYRDPYKVLSSNFTNVGFIWV